MRIVDFIKGLLDSILSGSLERVRIINAMNDSFKEAYYSGELDRLCKTSIAMGDSSFAHEMSAFVFRSGFKISIENDNNIKISEYREVAQYILANKPFVRQLMSIGFDTLIIKGKSTSSELKYSLKQYSELNGFMLSSGE